MLATPTNPPQKRSIQSAKPAVASISGFCKSTLYRENTPITNFDLYISLGDIASNVNTSNVPLPQKLKIVSNHIGMAYEGMYWAGKKAIQPGEFQTRLCFYGFDPSNGKFFISSCKYDKENPVKLVEEDLVYAACQGEDKLVNALLTSPGSYSNIISAQLSQTIIDLRKWQPVPEERLSNSIVELFEVHRKHATVLSGEPGRVGPPYLIYKITKESVIELHPKP